ncbi:TIGR00297 family protein [Nitzschia inconspicua]|uniref:TIGR00297 family protein n=1 Tax=Nitzschia inconspicua TaxID=303405 RepID=A0A9K3LDL7_9STRA|nr:TIGR00297 family protein [Nitzschia inconspicua]
MSLFRYDGNVPLLLAFGWNAVLFLALRSKLLKVLTPPGYFHAFALGTLLWNTLGWRGWTLCVLYLALGSLVTKVKFQEKQNMGIAEGRDGRRGPENVWGSAATGLLCAVCSVQGQTFLGIPSEMYVLGYVASLATKLSDTFASEIGKAYGKTTFLITTLERVEPGTEGAVSLEGTLASIVGGTLITLYGLAVGLIPTAAVPVSVVAAFVATNVESWLGATLQGRDDLKWITNEVVNFFNTLIGAILAIGAGLVLL